MKLTSHSQITAIILAGGKGTRMQSDLPKVLHTIQRKPIILHTLHLLNKLNLKQIIIVVGYKKEEVIKKLGNSWQYVIQDQQLGTGNAVIQALPLINPTYQNVIVLNGDDSAFYQPKTLQMIINSHLEKKVSMTIVTSNQKNVDISGRVIRDDYGKFIGIKANRELTESELKKNNELVCGLFLFNRKWLKNELPKIKKAINNEYPLTSLIGTAFKQKSLQDITLEDPNEWKSINTQRELQKARRVWRLTKKEPNE